MNFFTLDRSRKTFCAVLMGMAAGCGSGETGDGIAREPISGKVTLGGAPLNNASIQFIPSDPKAGTGTSAEIKAGEFAIPKERGAAPGGYKVMISSVTTDDGSASEAPGAPSKPKADPIPKKYNVNSTLNAEVKADAPNEFTFSLDTK
ncbi:hypothetical protein [Paludisphaera rhizosphaerae]|uniref:hypothetical protein n=1 Tax=Paludisphaera rhizosphaerae TaxID=2711216 RepID=UPI001C6F09FB|nr:hypothetical protein [Paludisphaera rhizosphaerae]